MRKNLSICVCCYVFIGLLFVAIGVVTCETTSYCPLVDYKIGTWSLFK